MEHIKISVESTKHLYYRFIPNFNTKKKLCVNIEGKQIIMQNIYIYEYQCGRMFINRFLKIVFEEKILFFI